VYGAINIAAQSQEHLPWNRAFRFLYPPAARVQSLGAPFLTLQLRYSLFVPATTDATLHSASTIWLTQAQAFNSRVGASEADHNLHELAQFAQLVARGLSGRPPVSELHLEGSVFQREADRIRRAFAGVLPD
jgi:hypothetical protein